MQRLSDRLAEHEPLRRAPRWAPPSGPVGDRAPIDRSARPAAGATPLAHERAFTAQAAHAVRTPLAGIDAQLAMCLRELPEPISLGMWLASRGAVIVPFLGLASAVVLLWGRGFSWVDLGLLLRQFPIERLEVDLQATHLLDADPDLLAAAFGNLLDNAQRHGATRVTVSTPSPHTLRLDDDGPGVTAERRAALCAALDTQTYEGVGSRPDAG